MASNLTCSVDGCERPLVARGLCGMHYQRLVKFGTTDSPWKSPLERWLAKIDKNGPIPAHRPDLGNCWTWTASSDGRGYGVFQPGDGSVKAYKWGYLHFVGEVPAGLELDHLCKNPPCSNPWHLEPVSHHENVLRGESPTAVNARKTHCIHGHEFTPENTKIESDGRRCLQCRTDKERRRGARRKEARRIARLTAGTSRGTNRPPTKETE